MQELSTPFEEHDLVWAKVQNYPWWPAKIVQIFQQNYSLFFKISFYADPTYCYIREEAIVAFGDFEETLNDGFAISDQLQRAIVLANNAFQRKRLAIQQKQNSAAYKQPLAQQLESQIAEEHPEKASEFEQETIPIDFETENSNRKTGQLKKATQIQNLLFKYKLHQIPLPPKSPKIPPPQDPQSEEMASGTQSDEEDKAELFDQKNAVSRKNSKKVSKRKPIAKRKCIGSMPIQQRRAQLMKKMCSMLISKGIKAHASRQITIKMMQRSEHERGGYQNQESTQVINNSLNIKLMQIISTLDPACTYEQKLVHILRSSQAVTEASSGMEKDEEQKTSMTLTEEVPVVC